MLNIKETKENKNARPEIGKVAEKGKYNREKAAPGHLTSAPIGLTKKTAQPNTLQRYLSDISQYKLLTREEEISLATRLHRHGDKAAANRLITSNLRLVVKIALDYRRLWMQNLMDSWRLVKIGTTQAQRKLFFRLKKEKQKLRDMGFEPKAELLSERLGVTQKEVVEMDQRINGWDISLDAPLTEDSDTARIEFLKTSSESLEEKISKKEIEAILHQRIAEFKKEMNQRERDIFNQRIFAENPKTLAEIGKRYGISRERVRQIQKNIIVKMKDSFKHALPDYAAYSEGD